jgi:enoyl-CoA hydratase
MSEIVYQSNTEKVNSWLDGSTLYIEFNNPARHNALSVDMWEAVPILLNLAETDSRVRLVVFKGAGTKAFVSGADISQFEDMRAAREAVTRYEAMAEAALMGIYNFSKPTLAAIQGYCIGGGVNVAISCDMRIATAEAVFSVPAARLGLGYRYSAMKNLINLIARRCQGFVFHCPKNRWYGSASAWPGRAYLPNRRITHLACRIHQRLSAKRAVNHSGSQSHHPRSS